MATLFQYIDAICQKKVIDEPEEDFEREYSQFMINKFFSCDRQLAPLANLLNDRSVTNRMHFDFYFNLIPKGKRWIKYNAKKQKADKEIKYVMEFYKCGLQAAKKYHQLISKEDMKLIKDFFEKRGKKR